MAFQPQANATFTTSTFDEQWIRAQAAALVVKADGFSRRQRPFHHLRNAKTKRCNSQSDVRRTIRHCQARFVEDFLKAKKPASSRWSMCKHSAVGDMQDHKRLIDAMPPETPAAGRVLTRARSHAGPTRTHHA